MKVTLTSLIGIFFFILPGFALEAWETCLDKGDFLFTANSFTKSHRVSKDGCMMRFVEIGGKGKKYEINLCDPRIHIDEFGSLDATSYTRHFAGSTGCPVPLFGADFDLPKDQKGAKEFSLARTKILEMQNAIKQAIAPDSSPADIEKHKNAQVLASEVKFACSQLLLTDYLERCITFEAKEVTSQSEQQKSNIPGVHDQTIQIQKDSN